MSDEMQTGEGMEIPAAGGTVEQTDGPAQVPEQEAQNATQPEQAPPGDDRVEKAFAKRLAHEREKLQQQFAPQLSFVEAQAQKYGLTPEQYIAEVERSEKEAERQALMEQGIDPEYLDQVVSNNPIVRQAQALIEQQREQQRFNAEAQELFNTFPDLTPDKVPPEVFKLKAERGVSLLDAYLRMEYPRIKDSARREGEQAAIGAMQAPSPGSLTAPADAGRRSVMDLSKDEFQKILDEVKSGVRKQI